MTSVDSNVNFLCGRPHGQRRQSGFKSGSRGSGSKNFDFLGKFNFFRLFHKQKIYFSGQISEKF